MSDAASQRGQRSALIAIDGTDSREWRVSEENSHVLRFFREYQGNKVKNEDTTHGPKTLGGDVEQIFQHACQDATNFYNSGIRTFDVVGHSRGGHIAIRVSQLLLAPQYRGASVRFLGLFDAVDRSPDETVVWGNAPGTGIVPPNVKVCRHARRSMWTGNRTCFGNTATRHLPQHADYEEQTFWASHGGLGGDQAQSWSIGDGKGVSTYVTGGMTLLTPPSFDRKQSDAVRNWMREQAVGHGVPLGLVGDFPAVPGTVGARC